MSTDRAITVLLGSLEAARARLTGIADGIESADAHRHLLRLVSAALELFVERADPLRPLPTVWMSPTRKFLGDSPDTIYTTIPVSAACRYRLTIDPGAARYVGVVAYGRETDGGAVRIVASANDHDLPRDPEGRFVVEIGAASGDGLVIDPSTFWVMVRQYFRQPYPDQPGSVRVERMDGVAPDTTPDPVALAAGIERAAAWVDAQVRADLALDAIIEDPTGRLTTDPTVVDHAALVSQFFPTPDVSYQGCRVELAPDQQLRVDVRPPACRYWSVSVMTPWLESLEGRVVAASINGERATPNPDGSYTVVIADGDPGVANWIPLRGYRRIQVAYRVLLGEAQPEPASYVVEPTIAN